MGTVRRRRSLAPGRSHSASPWSVMSLVYVLASPVDGNVRYVGQTKRAPITRLNQHIAKAHENTRCHSSAWIRGLLNSGVSPVMVTVQDQLTPELADELEEFLIFTYRDKGISLVNAAPGGMSRQGWKHSEEYKQRRSELYSGSNHPRYGKKTSQEQIDRANATRKVTLLGKSHPMLGRKHSEEARSKMRAARALQVISSESRAKRSESLRKRRESPDWNAKPFLGRKHTPEAIAKMRAAKAKKTDDV